MLRLASGAATGAPDRESVISRASHDAGEHQTPGSRACPGSRITMRARFPAYRGARPGARDDRDDRNDHETTTTSARRDRIDSRRSPRHPRCVTRGWKISGAIARRAIRG